MNVALLLAGVLSFVAAAIHGIAGDVLVVRRLEVGTLPSTPFGGPAASKLMIRVSWHLVTTTFAILGAGLVACAFDGAQDACRRTVILVASAFSAFAFITIAAALWANGPAGLFRHPAPTALTAIAVLAWWGSF